MRFCDRFSGYEDEEDDDADETASEGEDITSPRVEDKENKEAAALRIDKLLRRPILSRRTIRRVFRDYADEEDVDGNDCLTTEQAEEMIPDLAEALKLPEWVFNGLQLLMERFDFDGTGMLREREAVKMYFVVMQQRRKEIAGRRQEVKVRNSTIAKSGYTVLKELGKGGQGTMYLCSYRWNWKQYCIKFYSKAQATAGGIQELIDEFSLMKSLSSQYVARTYEVFQDQNYYYLVNEPYFGGDLTKLGKLAYDDGVSMSEDWWRGLFRQMVEGVIYLHSKATMHCDIKEPNVMIADNKSYEKPRPVLIDFGLSVVFGSETQAICGTPGYIPPETWRKSTWYPNGDMFSLGVTMFQLLCGRVPQVGLMGVLQSRDLSECVKAAETKPLPWDIFPPDMPDLRDLIEKMTERNRHDRLRPSAVLEHDWFVSESDAALPERSLQGLIGKAAEREAEDFLVAQLAEANNIDECRALNAAFVNADLAVRGVVDCETALALLRPRGAHPNAIQAYVLAIREGTECVGTDPYPYTNLMKRVIEWKSNYDEQHIQDQFHDLDQNGDGALDVQELKAMLHGDAFELPPDEIQALVSQMQKNAKGKVEYAEFKRVVVEDGRVGRKAFVDGRQSIFERAR